jgi:hypothetical protein
MALKTKVRLNFYSLSRIVHTVSQPAMFDFLPKRNLSRAGSVAQVVVSLPCKWEVLSTAPHRERDRERERERES